MNRFTRILIAFSVLLAALGVGTAVKAQSEPGLSEAHLKRISQNCIDAKTTLVRLHTNNDVPLRQYLGTFHERIATKLMAPFNARALNRQVGLDLAATSLEYNRQMDVFRASYIQYDESMTKADKIDCNKPAEFYESVRSTREKRQKLHEDTVALSVLLQTYKTEFEAFAKEHGATQ